MLRTRLELFGGGMLNDLKFALRQLRKSPGFTVTAVLTLAIGIGVNTAMFSVTDATMLRPLAIPDLGRVVALSEIQNRDTPKWVALGNYEEWAQQSRSFEGLAVRTDEYLNMTGAGDAARVQAAAVSPNCLGLLQVHPLIGHDFSAEDAHPGRDDKALLSYSLWQRQFGGEADIAGKKLELDGRAYTVIGVMPKTVNFPLATDLYVPLAPTPAQMRDRNDREYHVIGRLRSGVSVQAAQAEMDGIAAQLAKTYPATNVGWGVKVEPLLENVTGPLTPLIMKLILAATGIVLLIVCANVANLQFARGLGRRNEMAVRTALGGQRLRLMRQLLAENVLLGLLGAAGGLVLAKLDLQMVLAMMPDHVSRWVAGWNNIALNGRALALSIAVAVAAGVVSGLAPAREALRVDLVEHLKADGRTATGSAR
ncbi:MAG TPA: ABC transporter permease, partial [Acidobacteriaceae bacterium]|nr:ABC transporter permease [Acidobacteriaceae bacterium]